MLVEVKKTISLTNGQIAASLVQDGGVIDVINEIISEKLFDDYRCDLDTREDAVNSLTTKDYIEILEAMVDEMRQASHYGMF